MPSNNIHTYITPDAVFKYKAKEHSVARNEGFAIVIALSLMSFVLLMLVTLTALARVESQAAQIHQKKLLAKENARLGLMIALGNLQRYAGPDQRVTANAEIDLAHTPSSKFWSGIWVSDSNEINTGDPVSDSNEINTGDPVWLVSGIPEIDTENLQTNPLSVTIDNPVEVFPSTSDESEVIVGTIPIIDKNANTSGEIAYWLSDESSKVRLNLKPESDEMSYLTAEDKQNINESYLSFPVQDKIFREFSPLSETKIEDFARVLNPNQIDHIIPTRTDTSNQTILDASHDFTTRSASVITNMGKGGLKKNLTGRTRAQLNDILEQPDYLNDNYLSGDYLTHYNINPKTGKPNQDAADPNESHELDQSAGHFTSNGAIARQAVDDFFDYRDNDTKPDDNKAVPVHTAMPIISEMSFRLGAFHTQSDAKHRIRFHVDVEFWNPYPYPIKFPADGVKDRCFIVMIVPSNIGSDGTEAEKMILSIENVNTNEELHTNLFNYD
ncbi:MAG: hypothetical protein VXX82_04950, partial [Verrucomicrobiota bacterium]|nr:hypothetical protein [Verrucomicrobiota bacterium]